MTLIAFPNREDRFCKTSTEELHADKKECERVIFGLTRQIAFEHQRRDRIVAEISLREQEAKERIP